jgi:hypothetical protein
MVIYELWNNLVKFVLFQTASTQTRKATRVARIFTDAPPPHRGRFAIRGVANSFTRITVINSCMWMYRPQLKVTGVKRVHRRRMEVRRCKTGGDGVEGSGGPWHNIRLYHDTCLQGLTNE